LYAVGSPPLASLLIVHWIGLDGRRDAAVDSALVAQGGPDVRIQWCQRHAKERPLGMPCGSPCELPGGARFRSPKRKRLPGREVQFNSMPHCDGPIAAAEIRRNSLDGLSRQRRSVPSCCHRSSESGPSPNYEREARCRPPHFLVALCHRMVERQQREMLGPRAHGNFLRVQLVQAP
jgi:hypothetical protein